MNIKFNEIRVLETGNNTGAWNMALDEVLLAGANNTPVLRIYGWDPPCVSIGYFQSIRNEIHLQTCKQQNVDIVRRITGGGAVYHDCELTYSFITRKYPHSILDSYKIICGLVTAALKKLGMDAVFCPLNDVTVNNKKVCGSAQTRKKNTLLQHGTILLRVNQDKMFSILNVSKEKIRDKNISHPRQRVAGVNKNFDQVAKALKQSAIEVFGAKLIFGNITRNEYETAKRLVTEKYSKEKWNYRR